MARLKIIKSKLCVAAIDEAAAIPLPTIKKLMGPYLVFMSSTVNGYEGTGRALSLKLIQQLRAQQGAAMAQAAQAAGAAVAGSKTKKGERQVHEDRWLEDRSRGRCRGESVEAAEYVRIRDA